jgi:malonyl-CoA O-methyltransferase
MPSTEPTGPERRLVRRSFDRAAYHYDQVATLQREVADCLLERLELIRIRPHHVADLGSGTGYCTRRLHRRYPGARVMALDLSLAMLREARRIGPRLLRRPAYVCGDMQALPFAAGAFDLVLSSLTLQWCTDLFRTFQGLRQALTPGGLLLFATFGPDTLRELRESWSKVDHYVHVNPFPDMHVVGDAMTAAGLRDVVVDVDRIATPYPDVYTLMKELKGMGAHNVNRGRSRTLTGKGRLNRLVSAYERLRRDGSLPVSYEVVYGHAWAPDAPGSVAIPLDTIAGSRR